MRKTKYVSVHTWLKNGIEGILIIHSNEQKATIEKLAQGVLDTRAKFPNNSLADLYDPLTMPPELQKAHRELDSAVMKLYGFGKNMAESDIVARLLEMYRKLVESKK